MTEWMIFLVTGAAICALAYSVWAARAASAMAAHALSMISGLEKSERLTPSKLAELAEFNEGLKRAEELLVKVNRREIARAKKRSDDGTFVNGAHSPKDELRIRAGLRAGRPAPHQ